MKKTFGATLRLWLEMTSVVLTIAVCVALLWRGGLVKREVPTRTPPKNGPAKTAGALPLEPVSIVGAASKGDLAAPLVLIVFSDFQCPFCSRFAAGPWKEIDRTYVQTGKLQVVFRHLPLGNHERAFPSAEAAECAGSQGKFWEMHDLIFSNQANLEDTSLREHAQNLGLNKRVFEQCMLGVVAERIREDMRMAKSLKIAGTPTFLIGRRQPDGRVIATKRIAGAGSFEQFSEAIEALASGGA